MVMSRNFFVTATDVRRRTQFYFVQPVTLGYDSCNLCHKSATKFRDKLQEKFPSVTAPLEYCFARRRKSHSSFAVSFCDCFYFPNVHA